MIGLDVVAIVRMEKIARPERLRRERVVEKVYVKRTSSRPSVKNCDRAYISPRRFGELASTAMTGVASVRGFVKWVSPEPHDRRAEHTARQI
ncbi:MAG: hypothetical protein AUG81_12540 [Verrucomicrobia bacterium 13_1_20CM_4_54_11]|nr:MAG: hypothetical protein AUG81_12540 [Verrucomicrobia bacterium 13_1_20CM_4_54_11]